MNNYYLTNPFTPSEIVSTPDLFYGRATEIQTLTRYIRQGNVAIQGGIGIGKSSLLSRTLLHLNGFNSSEHSESINVVMNSEIESIEDVARFVLEKLISVDATQNKLILDLKFIKYESTEAFALFKQNRHLASLLRILKDKSFSESLDDDNSYFIIAIDEADKCPRPLARFIRNVLTELQLEGFNNFRFILSGIGPFVDEMISEDGGIIRFITRRLNLGKMDSADADNLITSKLSLVTKKAEESGLDVRIDPDVVTRIVKLSGCHPHLLQLLGSHLLEHEIDNPDNLIDNRDLIGSLREICFMSRGTIYNKIISNLKNENKYYVFLEIIKLVKDSFPGTIDTNIVNSLFLKEDIDWLISQNIIYINSINQYEIIDEFLRIRILIDEEEKDELVIENRLLYAKSITDYEIIESLSEEDDVFYLDSPIENPDYDLDSESEIEEE